MKLTEACMNQMSCCAGVVLEEAESIIKGVIAENDMLPKHYKHLDADAWGIELADYFECVAGKTISELHTPHAITLHSSYLLYVMTNLRAQVA